MGGGGTSGDLFGPYLLTLPDKLDMNGEGSADERDITEEQKRSGGRNKRSLRGAHMVEQFCQKMSRKVKTVDITSQHFMVSECLLLHLQEPATGPYFEPDESSTDPPILLLCYPF